MPPGTNNRVWLFLLFYGNRHNFAIKFCKAFPDLQQQLAGSSNRSHYWKLEMANNENLSAARRQITVQEVTGLFLRAPPNAFALFNFLRCIKKTRSSNDIYPAVPVNLGIFKSRLTICEHNLPSLFDLSKYCPSS